MAPQSETNPHFLQPSRNDALNSPRLSPPPQHHGENNRRYPPRIMAPPQHQQVQQHQMTPKHEVQEPLPNDDHSHRSDEAVGAMRQSPRHPRHHPMHGLRIPLPQKTNPITWLTAALCAIFWIIMFLGGVLVLIIYLVFRPKNPHFDVSSATLNFAYLDTGNLLNADMTLLTNFSNPNHKVRVDFSYMVIDLYYEGKLIATQFIEPFSAAKGQSRFVYVDMITSQIRLSLAESQKIENQINKNGLVFQVKGLIKARSNLGSLLKYSYWLYAHCTIMVTAPPNGVLIARRCKTKR